MKKRKKKCIVRACGRVVYGKGLCRGHYERQRRGRPLEGRIRRRIEGPISRRLRAHVKVDKETGCHLWKGYRDPCGYGRMTVGRTQITVHRLAWMEKYGPIPEDKVVMHTCHNPGCCNPDHLRLGTRAENNRDRVTKGRTAGCRARDLERHPQWK
jgi:hypothetical protein